MWGLEKVTYNISRGTIFLYLESLVKQSISSLDFITLFGKFRAGGAGVGWVVQCWVCRKGNYFFAFWLNYVYYKKKSIGHESTQRSLLFICYVNLQSHEWIVLSTSSDIFERTEKLVYNLHDKTENSIALEVSVIT